jgi:hypothetical protein
MVTLTESTPAEFHLGDSFTLSKARPSFLTPASPSTRAAIPFAAAQLSGPPNDSPFGFTNVSDLKV